MGSAITPASTTYLYPSNPTLAGHATLNPLWRDTTTWVVTGTPVAPGTAVAIDQYVIFEAFLNNY